MAALAEQLVDVVMAQLSLELDTLDQDEWDARREALIQGVTQVLAAQHPQTQGWGPWRRHWRSLCSKHRRAQAGCAQCAGGWYAWALPAVLGHLVYRRMPRLWRWWVNRPHSRTRQRLEAHFPKLRGNTERGPRR